MNLKYYYNYIILSIILYYLNHYKAFVIAFRLPSMLYNLKVILCRRRLRQPEENVFLHEGGRGSPVK